MSDTKVVEETVETPTVNAVVKGLKRAGEAVSHTYQRWAGDDAWKDMRNLKTHLSFMKSARVSTDEMVYRISKERKGKRSREEYEAGLRAILKDRFKETDTSQVLDLPTTSSLVLLSELEQSGLVLNENDDKDQKVKKQLLEEVSEWFMKCKTLRFKTTSLAHTLLKERLVNVFTMRGPEQRARFPDLGLSFFLQRYKSAVDVNGDFNQEEADRIDAKLGFSDEFPEFLYYKQYSQMIYEWQPFGEDVRLSSTAVYQLQKDVGKNATYEALKSADAQQRHIDRTPIPVSTLLKRIKTEKLGAIHKYFDKSALKKNLDEQHASFLEKQNSQTFSDKKQVLVEPTVSWEDVLELFVECSPRFVSKEEVDVVFVPPVDPKKKAVSPPPSPKKAVEENVEVAAASSSLLDRVKEKVFKKTDSEIDDLRAEVKQLREDMKRMDDRIRLLEKRPTRAIVPTTTAAATPPAQPLEAMIRNATVQKKIGPQAPSAHSSPTTWKASSSSSLQSTVPVFGSNSSVRIVDAERSISQPSGKVFWK